jgi:MFS family permease
MTDASYEQVAAMHTTAPSAAAEVEVRLTRWQSFLVAVASLVGIFGAAFGVMLVGGVVIHAFDPRRRVDIFTAFHSLWVVGVLLGIAVLWLLPPYPWVKRVITPASPEHPASAAGGTGDGGAANAVQLDGPGPGTVPRPVEPQGVGT